MKETRDIKHAASKLVCDPISPFRFYLPCILLAGREILRMRSSTLLSFGLSLSTLCIASPAANDNYSLQSRAGNSSAANTTCASGVHMIVARASTEAPGEGIIGAVATQVQQSVPGSDSEAVDYPATLTDYLNSEASGVTAMTKLIQSYVARCPNSKIALLGYSQVFSFRDR
jgi:acetylxylan esterase